MSANKKILKSTFFLGNKIEAFKLKLPHWLLHFKYGCILDSNQHKNSLDYIVAVSDQKEFIISPENKNSFEELKKYVDRNSYWKFGFLSYDLKNQIEQLDSKHFDGIKMPLLHFFSPQILIQIKNETIEIECSVFNPQKILDSIWDTEEIGNSFCSGSQKINARETEKEYKEKIKKIKNHIIEGDIYEMNYCTEFYMNSCYISPAALFSNLNTIAKAPFTSFYKYDDKYLICGSPERFLKKENQKLISQPIKGTAPRGKNKKEDLIHKNNLFHSEKDRAENVMIVDLVRNDLAKTCKSGTVNVDELFGIYGFEQVWQMISTISGTLQDDIHFIDAIKNAFPMGSMTGAPKVMAMKLIEQYETSKRGLYSGAVGYITPQNNFDFNVVIRSILYNEAQHYLSFHVGGAIVYDSDPQLEYQECLLKAQSMIKALGIQ